MNAVSGGEPSATTLLDVTALLLDRDALEQAVLASGTGGGLPATEERLRDVGRQLFEALFVGPVLGTYRASMGVAMQRGEPLRVVLRFTVPKLAALPWEVLDDLEAARTSAERSRSSAAFPRPTHPSRSGSIHRCGYWVWWPHRRGVPELDVAYSSGCRRHWPIRSATGDRTGLAAGGELGCGARKAAVRTRHVLHFIGHGDYDVDTDQGLIALVGADDGPDAVDARDSPTCFARRRRALGSWCSTPAGPARRAPAICSPAPPRRWCTAVSAPSLPCSSPSATTPRSPLPAASTPHLPARPRDRRRDT